MKYQLLLAAALAALATPAYAQDLSGVRIEARLGWEQVRPEASYPYPEEDEDVEGDEILTASEKDSGLS